MAFNRSLALVSIGIGAVLLAFGILGQDPKSFYQQATDSFFNKLIIVIQQVKGSLMVVGGSVLLAGVVLFWYQGRQSTGAVF